MELEKPAVLATRIENLSDKTSMGGAVEVIAIKDLLRPVVIIKEAANSQGPSLELCVDYYAPAVAAKMGLPVESTIYIIRTEGEFDDTFNSVSISNLKGDPWGRVHASGQIVWRDLGHPYFKQLMAIIGQPESRQLGKVGLFNCSDGVLRRFKIEGYDGNHYWASEKVRINGFLMKVE